MKEYKVTVETVVEANDKVAAAIEGVRQFVNTTRFTVSVQDLEGFKVEVVEVDSGEIE